MTPPAISPRIPGCAIFILSASALAYEVLLVRLLSMTRFYHLAFMVLSLALLGYGASGAVLAHGRRFFLKSLRGWFALFSALFAVTAVGCYQLSQHIPLHPGQWLWSPGEAVSLVALYLVLSLPFLGAACAVGLAYCFSERDAGRIYRADLSGAALGSLAGLAVLWLPEARGLWLPWCGGLTAAALIVHADRKPIALVLILLAAAGPLSRFEPAVQILPAADKPLSIALSAHGAEKMADVFTPVSRRTVLHNDRAPYRFAPGLSLAFSESVPAQWAAFSDGENPEPLLMNMSDDAADFLDYLPEALALHLRKRNRILVLDTFPTAHPVRTAIRAGAAVDMVLSNPGWRTLDHRLSLSASLGSDPGHRPRLTIQAARQYLTACTALYDLIVLAQPVASDLRRDHLHTVEAVDLALSKLTADGALCVSAPSDLPPRAGLRLLATAAAALNRRGVTAPADHLVMIRSLRTVFLMVHPNPVTADAVDQIRAFCMVRHFDPVWFPGVEAAETDRWNRLGAPIYYQYARKILAPASGITGVAERTEPFQKNYKFDVSPLWDDRPYFAHFLKPGTFKELFNLRAGGGLGLLSFAEPVLAVTLVQAVALSLLVVWLPLRPFRPRVQQASRESIRWGAIYIILGIGFMLVEYAVVEKMSFFLNTPVTAVAVTLAGFLAMAALGGGLSVRCSRGRSALQRIGTAALAVVAVVLLYMTLLPPVLGTLLGLQLVWRIVLALGFMAPLALALGFPFPLALSHLKQVAPASQPWAWGLNGCGSLIGPVLGLALAIYGGTTIVLAAGGCCYGVVFAMTMFSRSKLSAS